MAGLELGPLLPGVELMLELPRPLVLPLLLLLPPLPRNVESENDEKNCVQLSFEKMTEELFIGAKQSSLGALVTRCSINQKSLISGHISFYLKFMFFKVGQKVNKYLSHFVKNYGKKIFQKWPNLVTLKW